MKVVISKKNSKLGKIWNVSLLPIVDCPNCESCKGRCYAKRIKRFPQPWKAYENNSAFLREDRLGYYLSISKQLFLAKRTPDYFRIHTAGDFVDQYSLDSWKMIAHAFPHIRFLAFTKMNCLDYRNLPSNMKVILSQWTGAKKLRNKHIKQSAWLSTDKRARGHHCSGTCDKCAMCWNSNEDVILKMH